MQIHRILHFYYCAYISIKFAGIYDNRLTPEDKTLHLIHWLNAAGKKKSFRQNCDSEIKWLLSVIKKHGMSLDVERLLLHVYTTTVTLLKSSPV